jgi:hypothetical protein
VSGGRVPTALREAALAGCFAPALAWPSVRQASKAAWTFASPYVTGLAEQTKYSVLERLFGPASDWLEVQTLKLTHGTASSPGCLETTPRAP